jgi:predicted RNase H-like HicB family nuclease
MTYTVLLVPADEGGYTVSVPALPGCITEGDSMEEALAMAREAIESYLYVLAEDGDPIPAEGADVVVRLGDAPEAILRRVTVGEPA